MKLSLTSTDKGLILFFVLLALLCALLCVALPFSKAALHAEIYLDGTLVKSVYLPTLREPLELEVGSGNRVLLSKDGAEMVWADCPDQSCVACGKTTAAGLPIVCLPNRVIVRLTGGTAEEIDAVAG